MIDWSVPRRVDGPSAIVGVVSQSDVRAARCTHQGRPAFHRSPFGNRKQDVSGSISDRRCRDRWRPAANRLTTAARGCQALASIMRDPRWTHPDRRMQHQPARAQVCVAREVFHSVAMAWASSARLLDRSRVPASSRSGTVPRRSPAATAASSYCWRGSACGRVRGITTFMRAQVVSVRGFES